MIFATFRKKFVRFENVWFADSCLIDKEQQSDSADILVFQSLDSNICLPQRNYFYKTNYTLISDLSVDEDSLLLMNSKNGRNEIRRVKRDANVNINIYSPNMLEANSDIINEFEREYSSFVARKGIASAYNKEAIHSYIEQNSFIITCATIGDAKVYHSYIYQNTKGVLLYSATNQYMEELNRSISGRANRFLHWQDILFLKKEGVKQLDWGGVGNFKFDTGISKFKKSFGGTPKKTYTLLVANSFKGKFAVFLIKKLQIL